MYYFVVNILIVDYKLFFFSFYDRRNGKINSKDRKKY